MKSLATQVTAKEFSAHSIGISPLARTYLISRHHAVSDFFIVNAFGSGIVLFSNTQF